MLHFNNDVNKVVPTCVPVVLCTHTNIRKSVNFSSCRDLLAACLSRTKETKTALCPGLFYPPFPIILSVNLLRQGANTSIIVQ